MGMLDPNDALGALRGKVGGLIFSKRADGRIVVRAAPGAVAAPSEAQLANRNRFGRGSAYVRGLKAQPEAYAIYKHAGKQRRKRACDLAVADALKPPELRDIDVSGYTGKAGEIIRMEAVDDFEVASITVVIADINGVVLEQGVAARDSKDARPARWLYVTTAELPAGELAIVHVSASDHPGNCTTKTVEHMCRR
jgi:hypothetical protein